MLGKSDSAKAALPLRRVLAETGLAPTHPLDLLTAFRTDVTKRRYANWDELMHYCRYSAMPVGRFVLDLHGEDRSTWAYSDPLCAALQVINHLQDCAKDYRALDRVYLPLDIMAAQGTTRGSLGFAQGRAGFAGLPSEPSPSKTAELMPEASKLPLAVKDARLGLETGVIVRLAHRLIAMLMTRDPLSESGAPHASSARCCRRREGRRRHLRSGSCDLLVLRARGSRDERSGSTDRQPDRARAGREAELVLSRHAHSAARAARGDVRGLCLLPRRRRYRRR